MLARAQSLLPLAQVIHTIYPLETIIDDDDFYYITADAYLLVISERSDTNGILTPGFVIGTLNNYIVVDYKPDLLTDVNLRQFLEIISTLTTVLNSKLEMTDIDKQIRTLLFEFVKSMDRVQRQEGEFGLIYKTDYCQCKLEGIGFYED